MQLLLNADITKVIFFSLWKSSLQGHGGQDCKDTDVFTGWLVLSDLSSDIKLTCGYFNYSLQPFFKQKYKHWLWPAAQKCEDSQLLRPVILSFRCHLVLWDDEKKILLSIVITAPWLRHFRENQDVLYFKNNQRKVFWGVMSWSCVAGFEFIFRMCEMGRVRVGTRLLFSRRIMQCQTVLSTHYHTSQILLGINKSF